MTTRKEFIQEALKWIGRPYKPSGSQECGANCLGVFIGIARNVGGLEGLVAQAEKYADYAKQTKPREFLKRLVTSDYLEHIHPKKHDVGNLLLICIQGEPQHLVLLTEPGIILHASVGKKKVIQHGLPTEWKIAGEFRIKALT